MDYRLRIARKYLFSRRKASLITVISSVSIVGVTVGVAALVVVLSVMNGFFEIVRDALISIDPHVRITFSEELSPAERAELSDATLKLDGVDEAAFFVQGRALLMHDGEAPSNKVVIVRGLESDNNPLSNYLDVGSADLSRRDDRKPGILIGSSLAARLGVYPDLSGESDRPMGLVSAGSVERIMTRSIGFPAMNLFELRGLYSLQSIYDESHVFVTMEEANRIFKSGERESGIELRLADLEDAEDIKESLAGMTAFAGHRVETWYDLQKSMYDVMKLEKFGAMLILFLVILVAAINIVGSLAMVVIEKRKDLGVLNAMGASAADAGRIFLYQGLLIGVIGTICGLVLGLGLSWVQKEFGIVKLANAESFVISTYPISVHATDVVTVVVGVLLLCVLAAWYPAYRASSLHPVEALRTG